MQLKNYYFSVLFLLLILTSCKQPQSNFQVSFTPSFDVLEEEIDTLEPNSLIVLDIDETIFSLDPTPANQESPFNTLVDTVIPDSEKGKVEQTLYKLIPLLIEPRIVDLIERLQQKGIKVIALTAGGHGQGACMRNMTDWRIHLLNTVGIHLERSFPEKIFIPFCRLAVGRKFPLFYRGVLFSQPSHKGIVLAKFLKAMKLKPTLYYFDNDVGNVEEIAETAKLLHISGKGFVYTGIQHLPAETIQLYRQKLKYLLKTHEWLSDSDAKVLKD